MFPSNNIVEYLEFTHLSSYKFRVITECSFQLLNWGTLRMKRCNLDCPMQTRTYVHPNLGLLDCGSFDILEQKILYCGAVFYMVGFLAVSLASTH